MTDADAQLKTRMRAEAPPSRDAWFRIAVMERMARRRLQRRLAMICAAGLAFALLLAPLAPVLSHLAADGVLLVAGALMAIAVTVWAIGQMRRPI